MQTAAPAAKSLSWAVGGIFRNECPRCARTKVFKNLFVMNRQCSACQHVYERENGYFLGAMVIGYVLSAFSAVPTIVLGFWVYKAEILPVTTLACVQVALLTPVIFRFARLAWIYLDFRADPSNNATR